MELQEHQRLTIASIITREYLSQLAGSGISRTALVEGRVMACGGVAVTGPGIGTLWAFVAQDAGPSLIGLDRHTRRLMEAANLRRIEATSEVNFQQGCRWLQLLGFKSEGVMHKYGLNGEDHIRYSRT